MCGVYILYGDGERVKNLAADGEKVYLGKLGLYVLQSFTKQVSKGPGYSVSSLEKNLCSVAIESSDMNVAVTTSTRSSPY